MLSDPQADLVWLTSMADLVVSGGIPLVLIDSCLKTKVKKALFSVLTNKDYILKYIESLRKLKQQYSPKYYKYNFGKTCNIDRFIITLSTDPDQLETFIKERSKRCVSATPSRRMQRCQSVPPIN